MFHSETSQALSFEKSQWFSTWDSQILNACGQIWQELFKFTKPI